MSPLVILHDVRRTHLCPLRVLPKFAPGTALTQEVPALIQLHLYLCQPRTVSLRDRSLVVKLVLFGDKQLDMMKNRLISCVFHPYVHDDGLQSQTWISSPRSLLTRS